MRLTKVHIQNFRGIKNLTIEPDRDITVLIGENNSGKTSILEALRIGLELIKSVKTCNFSEYDFFRDNKKNHISLCDKITLTYSFEESKEHPWETEIFQSLNEIIVGEEYAKINLQVSAWYEPSDKELKQEWNFLDNNGNIMSGKQNLLKELHKIRPFFYLYVIRDVKQEFHEKASFWSSFLRNKDINETTRIKLENELETINRKIVEAHTSFKDVEKEIKRLSCIIAAGKTDPVTIEPIPANVFNTLQHTQINVLTENNVKIPLKNHGGGTHSLSVLLLFSAYLKSQMDKEIHKLAEPIIAIEEPEAHLHPNAVRSLWNVLKSLPGQKIIATHSGDILSEVPLNNLRRVKKEIEGTQLYHLPESALTPEELRKFQHHVHRNRGELLFANCWLLVEGETEVSVISSAADILDENLSQYGIRLVEYCQAGGPDIFIKTADALNIQWHAVLDNDLTGKRNLKKAEELLYSRKKDDHINLLPYQNMDILLCCAGYGKPYIDGVPENRKHEITAPKDSMEYWSQVYSIINKLDRFSKPAAAMEAVLMMRKKGKDGVPHEIHDIINKAIRLTEIK